MNRILLIKLLGLLASAAAIATTAPAQLYTNLYQFEGNNQLYYGNNNSASPLTVIGSKLYGTTVGTAFSVNLDGSGYTSISNTNFYNSYYYGSYYYPATPNGLTVAGSTFYGTAQSGGTNYSGMVFSMSLDGSGFADLYDFSGIVGDGTSPQAAPTLVGATLYGTTYGGANGAGMIFSINTNGTGYADLYDFGTIVSDGNSPVATLRAIGSTLYGTTPGGGANSAGTIFSINTNGTGYTILYDFGSSLNDGSSPGGLLQVGSKFYGTTKGGGTWNYYGNGTIYSLNTDGTGYTILYNFGTTPNDGSNPNDLVLVGSTLYGTTSSGGLNYGGTVFSIDTNGTGYTILYNFGSIPNDGSGPAFALTAVGSTLYGTTPNGGSNGDGTLFALEFATGANAVISVFGNPVGDGTVTGTGMYPIGASVPITATASNGFVFTGWQDGNMQSPRTIIAPAGGATYTATFATPTRSIELSGNLAFGNVYTGGTATASLIISNAGNSTLTVSSISFPRGFSGSWTGTIPAGSSQAVPVTFGPTAVTSYAGTIRVTSDATDGTSTTSATGTGVGSPLTKIIGLTGTLAFGSINPGTTATAILTINNTGNTTLTVSNIAYPNGFSGLWTGTVPAGGSQDVTVTFTPLATTGYGGTIAVTSDATSGTGTISASGSGVYTPTKIIGLGGTMAFGNIAVTGSGTATLFISNYGNTTLTVSSIAYPNGFSGPWSGTILVGGTQPVSVTFAPAAATVYGGTITVNSDATGGTGTIAASGAGVITPTRLIGLTGGLNFGGVTTGVTATAILYITNTGNTNLTVTSIAYPNGFSGPWSGTIPAGSQHGVTVTFAPGAVANYGGTISVTSDATGGSGTISVSGAGVPAVEATAILTVDVNPATSTAGTVNGNGTFPVGSSQPISATANSGWVFTSWNDGNTQNPRLITVPAVNIAYTATFSPAVVMPTLAPPGGTYTNSVTVTLACNTTGATIHYTLDGTTPTGSSPTYKKKPLVLTSSATLQAIAVKAKLANSPVALALVTILPPPPLAITPTVLPAGVAKALYPGATVQATGGIGAYKWALASGKLPTGLKLNAKTGAISGTPTKPGKFDFIVKVTDTKKNTQSEPLTLTVTN